MQLSKKTIGWPYFCDIVTYLIHKLRHTMSTNAAVLKNIVIVNEFLSLVKGNALSDVHSLEVVDFALRDVIEHYVQQAEPHLSIQADDPQYDDPQLWKALPIINCAKSIRSVVHSWLEDLKYSDFTGSVTDYHTLQETCIYPKIDADCVKNWLDATEYP